MSFGGGFGQTLRQVIGTITIDLENNQILWKHTTLKLAPLKLAAPNVFFVEEQNAESGLTFAALVSIKGRSTDGNNAVAIFRDASRVIVDNSGRLSKQGLIHACQTPNGPFDEFYSYFNHLTFPDNYHGLIASTKYIDGTPIGIQYEFTASIQLVDKGCLLDDKTARFYRSTLANGNGVIVLNNGDSNVILWPDGNWVFYNI